MALSGGFPCYNVYETADGLYITLGALEPNFWIAFCNVVSRSDLLPHQYDAASISEVAGLFKTKTRDEWLAAFREADACVEPVNTVEEALEDPQVRHRGLAAQATTPSGSFNWFGSPFQLAQRRDPLPAPALGEHTRQILQGAGLGDEEIRDLEAAGVIKSA